MQGIHLTQSTGQMIAEEESLGDQIEHLYRHTKLVN